MSGSRFRAALVHTLKNTHSRRAHRPRRNASQAVSGPKTSMTSSRRHRGRRTVQSDGDGKMRSGDVERSGRAKLRHAKPHLAKSHLAKSHRGKLHCRTTPAAATAVPRLRCSCEHYSADGDRCCKTSQFSLSHSPSTHGGVSQRQMSPHATRSRPPCLFHFRRIKFCDSKRRRGHEQQFISEKPRARC
jgi:hypothetical protein